jgi:hypothetical protein
MDLFFSAPSWATRSVRLVLVVALGLGALIVAPARSGAAPTSAPAWVTLTVSSHDGRATVTWAPVTDSAVDAYVVDVFVYDVPSTSAQCGPDCTSRELRSLPAGKPVRVVVHAQTGGVAGPGTSSATTVIPNPCPSGGPACIRIDGTSDIGPITRVAQGFLHSNSAGLDPARVAALDPRSWRVAAIDGGYGYASFDAARASGAEVILVLSDALRLPVPDPATTGTLDDALATYRTAVRSYVQRMIAGGRVPDWWEIQNEPDTTSQSQATQLGQWKVAYEEIKALLPSAKILAPAPSRFMGTPSDATPYGLDLQTFLRFAVEHGLRPDAVGWHDIAIPSAIDFEVSPYNVLDHVATARRLLAEAGMPEVDIRIDEFAGREDGPIPGWQVGWFSALETARVDAAEHSCFPFPDGLSTSNGCWTPSLDNALSPANQSPRGNYWVELAYGRMSGRRLSTMASTHTLSTVATASADGGMTALVGRHATCLPGTNTACSLRSVSRPAAVDVPVTIAVPTATAALRVVVERVPFSSDPMPEPTPVLDSVLVPSSGAITFTLPRVADGDALILTLTPTAAPTPPPRPSPVLNTSGLLGSLTSAP